MSKASSSRIIPAIDLIEGKCVRLEEGDYERKKIYNEDPIEVALSFQDHGIRDLHLVDLDGAKAGQLINWKVLERICNQTNLHVDVGGGIKSDEDLHIAFESGAEQVNIGSLAVKEPEIMAKWIAQYSGEKILLSADSRDRKIAIHGWQNVTDIELFAYLDDYMKQGISTAVCTDIARDGMLSGPAFELYEEISRELPGLELVASGGVSSVDDVEKLIEMELHGIIIGKAIYEGRISLKQLSILID